MSGWGCDEGGDAEATRDGWGAAPTTTRPAVVSNLRDSAVGALFSPDEPSPNEWCGAGYRGRWGVGDGHEDRGDGDDAGGWGGDETFGDGDDAHDWGRSDVVDDDGMSVGAADDAAADDGGWGLADDHPDSPRDGPVITDAAARSNDEKGGPIGDADRSELRIATGRGDAPLRVADLADPADKENVEASKRRGVSHSGADAAAAVPAPPRRMHGWKSNWAVEGMVRAKANSLSAPSAPADGKRETSRETPRGAPSPAPSPAAGSRDADAADADAADAEARRACDARFAEEADAEEADGTEAPGGIHAWGSDCDSEDELLAGSGLTQTRPASPGAERRRAASLRAAVAARATSLKNAFELGAPPGRGYGARESQLPAAASVSASDSSDDDFGIAVSTRGRGKKKAAKSQPATKPATKAAKMKPAPRSPDAPRAFVPRGTVDLVDSDDDFDVVPESDAEADETDNGLFAERGCEEKRERDHRAAGRDVHPENSSYRGVGGPMSRLPRAPAPAPPAAWRRRLPHFTPASELTKGEYLDGEKVFIDYKSQFDGGSGDAKDSGGGGRWFREAGANKFVDADGEVLEGRAAWRASEREKKSAAAAARSRR